MAQVCKYPNTHKQANNHRAHCFFNPPVSQRGVCHVCKKKHFLDFSRRKKESGLMDAQDEESLKVRITNNIVERLQELFMMTSMITNIPSDICRAMLQIVSVSGTLVDITVSPDSASNVSNAEEGILHDVHESDSGPIGGFAGTGSMKRAGYVIKPHPSKPGATVVKAYVDKGHLPNVVGSCPHGSS